jgi:hypothetical protein
MSYMELFCKCMHIRVDVPSLNLNHKAQPSYISFFLILELVGATHSLWVPASFTCKNPALINHEFFHVTFKHRKLLLVQLYQHVRPRTHTFHTCIIHFTDQKFCWTDNTDLGNYLLYCNWLVKWWQKSAHEIWFPPPYLIRGKIQHLLWS